MENHLPMTHTQKNFFKEYLKMLNECYMYTYTVILISHDYISQVHVGPWTHKNDRDMHSAADLVGFSV
jgi:hypothetical protein